MEALHFFAAPFALSILLLGIHAYLGLHVLEREVIFVDISLSQVAALGTVVSLFFLAEGEKEWLATGLSLSFCLATAFALALLQQFEKGISQEALIGMTYAFASGALVLVADKLPHGAEHLKEALIGNILFVTWKEVAQTFFIYAVIAVIHVLFRAQFWRASEGKSGQFIWNFFFYFLFGIVITFSTKHAGVLVVFSILVAPAALARRLIPQWKQKILFSLGFAWTAGAASIALAFWLSYLLDLPAGASIVCTLSSLFFLALFLRRPASAVH